MLLFSTPICLCTPYPLLKVMPHFALHPSPPIARCSSAHPTSQLHPTSHHFAAAPRTALLPSPPIPIAPLAVAHCISAHPTPHHPPHPKFPLHSAAAAAFQHTPLCPFTPTPLLKLYSSCTPLHSTPLCSCTLLCTSPPIHTAPLAAARCFPAPSPSLHPSLKLCPALHCTPLCIPPSPPIRTAPRCSYPLLSSTPPFILPPRTPSLKSYPSFHPHPHRTARSRTPLFIAPL